MTQNLSPNDNRKVDLKMLQLRQAIRDFGVKIPEKSPDERINFDLFIDTLNDDEAVKEASRCLQCDIFCNICTTVCPNRSNVYYEIEPVNLPVQKAIKCDDEVQIINEGNKQIKQPYQIINIGDFCNECGNCTTFCPSAGEPYKDKPKFHLTKESFDYAVKGFYFKNENTMLVKDENYSGILKNVNGIFEYEDDNFKIVFNGYNAEKIEMLNDNHTELNLLKFAEYIFLYNSLKDKF